jgi:hypothetical protein
MNEINPHCIRLHDSAPKLLSEIRRNLVMRVGSTLRFVTQTIYTDCHRSNITLLCTGPTPNFTRGLHRTLYGAYVELYMGLRPNFTRSSHRTLHGAHTEFYAGLTPNFPRFLKDGLSYNRMATAFVRDIFRYGKYLTKYNSCL